MELSKEGYARKSIHNGSSVRTENSVTRDNCTASLSKHRDAEQLTSLRDFQSALHHHSEFLNFCHSRILEHSRKPKLQQTYFRQSA